MKVYESSNLLREELAPLQARGKTIALVPTMGALHAGHLALISLAKSYADVVVCSIFVNPTQFNNTDDLLKYPNTLSTDVELLSEEGCHFVFVPDVIEMYPNGIQSRDYDLGNIDEVMEGAFRPGHFNGVATVVSTFFTLIKPNVALFGEKDFQQVAVIRRMVSLDGHNVNIITAPTVREANGLAMSSRNMRLTKKQRSDAEVIYKSLCFARDSYMSFQPKELKDKVASMIDEQKDFDTEYISFCDAKTLAEINDWNESENVQACLAVYCGEVRLIDNLSLF